MSQIFTIKTLLESKCGHLNKSLAEQPKKKDRVIKPRNDCPEVIKMHWDLKYYCLEQNITFEKELRFCSNRKFRFDFALPDYKIAIEYDGLNSHKSGHTTLVGFTKDTEKRKLAIELGWDVLNYTVLNYQNVLQDIIKLIKQKNDKATARIQ